MPLRAPKRRLRRIERAYGRRLGFAAFATLSGALAFSLLTDAGRHTRAIAPLLPSAEQVLYWTGLRIDQVELSGQRFSSDNDIFNALDLQHARSLLALDTAAARVRIEELPWIATASINRVYPGSLEVRVSERKPAALWRKGGREYLIDDQGRVLSAVKAGTKLDLPLVEGEGAAAQAKALLDLVVRYPAIRDRFVSAERVGDRRWTLHLKNNVTVHMGSDREAAAFGELTSPDDLAVLLSGHDIVIDMRTRARITVRPAGVTAKTRAATQS
jgi:cell division protein FtsQ